MAQPIILDCDPGHDDAIALVLALASPELDVKAVTSSAGNQTPDKTLRNVLRMLTLLKRTDIPVAGAAVGEMVAVHRHGDWPCRRLEVLHPVAGSTENAGVAPSRPLRLPAEQVVLR